MQRVMSDDDLIAVMTPDMSPSQITLRPPDQADRGLPDGQLGAGDARADSCRSRTIASGSTPNVSRRSAPWKAIPLRSPRSSSCAGAQRIVLDSLQDLIRHMGAIREGRTAVIAVTDGWVLFRSGSER